MLLFLVGSLRVEWNNRNWEEVMGALASGRIVVPVVGPDILSVEVSADGPSMPFPLLLADRLAARLPAEQRMRLSAYPTLHEIAITSRWMAREAEFAADLVDVEKEALAEMLPRVLDPARPTALRWLAEISDFPLYLTITPDTLFEHVLRAVRGLTAKEVRTFHLERERGRARLDAQFDLPHGWEPSKPTISRVPTLFYLFGRLGGANFNITEEQQFEMLWRLQSEDYQPERLMRELRKGHILLLGTRFPDWIGRYFIRLVRGQRLVEKGDILRWSRKEPVLRLLEFILQYLSEPKLRRRIRRLAPTLEEPSQSFEFSRMAAAHWYILIQSR
jgi:hypothetical protein